MFNQTHLNNGNGYPWERAVPGPTQPIKCPTNIRATFWTNEHPRSALMGQWASPALMIRDGRHKIEKVITHTFILLNIHCWLVITHTGCHFQWDTLTWQTAACIRVCDHVCSCVCIKRVTESSHIASIYPITWSGTGAKNCFFIQSSHS